VDYQIAIPSYARANLLRDKTLAFLENQNVNPEIVTIFVANEAERERYAEVLDSKWQIVVGVINKLEQQKFYHSYYPKNTALLNIDDDVAGLKQRTPEGKLEDFTGTIDALCEQMFGLCQSTGARLWGINPVENGFFLSDFITVGLRFVCGTFYGNYAGDVAITKRDKQSSCEDFETTLRSFIENGSILRVEYLCPKTKYWADGGMDASLKDTGYDVRSISQEQILHEIVVKYPELVKLTSNKGGLMLRFKNITYDKIGRQ